tara:strand:- start:798 stop:1013 length:216 start_codon:yes stop_codon:yes gene_type:complete
MKESNFENSDIDNHKYVDLKIKNADKYMGLKQMIDFYQRLLDNGKIKKDGIANKRLEKLKLEKIKKDGFFD